MGLLHPVPGQLPSTPPLLVKSSTARVLNSCLWIQRQNPLEVKTSALRLNNIEPAEVHRYTTAVPRPGCVNLPALFASGGYKFGGLTEIFAGTVGVVPPPIPIIFQISNFISVLIKNFTMCFANYFELCVGL